MSSYEELSFYCQKLYDKGFAPGCSGNASIRKNAFIAITPSGVSLNDITSSNIVEIDLAGKLISSGKPSSEKMMHVGIYKNRSDINAILHTHSPFLSTFALKGLPIENSAIVELKYIFNGKVPVVPYSNPGSNELAESVAEMFKTHDAVIMQNHGAIVGAKTCKEAFYKYEVLEYTAQVILQAKVL